VTVRGCDFTSNIASRDDGGVRLYVDVQASLTDCVFTENSAIEHYGGGLAVAHSDVIVESTSFEANAAGGADGRGGGAFVYNNSTAVLTDCEFVANTCGLIGAGLAVSQHTTTTVSRCVFTENASGDLGGGASASDTILNLQSCTFLRNTAAQGGGLNLAHAGTPDPLAVVVGCTFLGNSATERGGGLLNLGMNIDRDIVNCNFIGN
jgi:hypothetical protein